MKLIYLVLGIHLVAGKKTTTVKQPNNAELDRLNRNRAEIHLDAAKRKLQKSKTGSGTGKAGSNPMNRRTRTNGAVIKPPPIVSCNECVNAGSDEECDQQNRFVLHGILIIRDAWTGAFQNRTKRPRYGSNSPSK